MVNYKMGFELHWTRSTAPLRRMIHTSNRIRIPPTARNGIVGGIRHVQKEETMSLSLPIIMLSILIACVIVLIVVDKNGE